MKSILLHACIALALAVPALASPGARDGEPAAKHESHEAHGAHGSADAGGLPAVRWQSDEPLREGMRRVRAATQALSNGEHGHLGTDQVAAVAQELEAAVHAMFAQCKLDPAPDAALHPLLARVLQASALLAGGEFDAGALAELEAVLARYPQLFADADWNAARNDPA